MRPEHVNDILRSSSPYAADHAALVLQHALEAAQLTDAEIQQMLRLTFYSVLSCKSANAPCSAFKGKQHSYAQTACSPTSVNACENQLDKYVQSEVGKPVACLAMASWNHVSALFSIIWTNFGKVFSAPMVCITP